MNFNHTLIKPYRLQAGLTQIQFAKGLGVTPLHLGKIERGQVVPRPHLQKKIMDLVCSEPVTPSIEELLRRLADLEERVALMNGQVAITTNRLHDHVTNERGYWS